MIGHSGQTDTVTINLATLPQAFTFSKETWIMLVLTRKQAETIQIGEDIVIKVIATGRGKVKLGIEAPASVRVLRGELASLARPASEPDGEMNPLMALRVKHPIA
jgi:carbon storage regulator